MKTKTYIFTANEIMVLRDALVELHQERKHLTPNSPIAKEQAELLIALKDQFKTDAALIR